MIDTARGMRLSPHVLPPQALPRGNERERVVPTPGLFFTWQVGGLSFHCRQALALDSLPLPALLECGHCHLACCLVAIGLTFGVRQRPHPWRSRRRRGGLEDAANDQTISSNDVVIVQPFSARTALGRSTEQQVSHLLHLSA